MMETIKKFITRKIGQGLVEYALILTLVAIVVIVLLGLIGDRVNSTFSRIVGTFSSEPDEIIVASEPPPECYSSLLLPIMVGAMGCGAGISHMFPKSLAPVPIT